MRELYCSSTGVDRIGSPIDVSDSTVENFAPCSDDNLVAFEHGVFKDGASADFKMVTLKFALDLS